MAEGESRVGDRGGFAPPGNGPVKSSPPVLRFGVLLGSTVVPRWVAAVLSELRTSGHADLALVVIDAAASRPRRIHLPASQGSISQTIGGIAMGVYAGWLSRATAREPVDIGSSVAGVSIVRCMPVRKGRHANAFDASDVESVRAMGLDFLLRFAFGILTGDILYAARYGVWSFHHGDEQRYRGQPLAFWELHDGEPVIGAVLQRLTERLDGGVILRKGYFGTVPWSYARTRDRVIWGAATWPAQVCRDIRAGDDSTPLGPPSDTRAPLRRIPSVRPLLRFAALVAWSRIEQWFRAAFRHDHWNIGIVRQPIASFLGKQSYPAVEWAPERRGRYAADPFGRVVGDDLEILVEDYPHASGRARIAALTVEGAVQWRSPVPALDTGSHLSYPFTLDVEGRLGLLPEARASGAVRLYESVRFPDRWREVAVLLPRGDVSDATLVHHEGRWWLFGVLADPLNPNTILLLWHAPDLNGPWIEHARNPVRVDVRGTRPAGPFFRAGGVLYRPVQDCASTYGARVVINRVVQLDPEHFQEEPAGTVEPDPRGPYPLGLHTLTGIGNVTLVDGKRRTWSWAATRRVVSDGIRQRLQRTR